MAVPQKPERIQKLCTLWIHEPSFSSEEVLFNVQRFPELKLTPGCLAKVIPIKEGTNVRDFVHDAPRLDHFRSAKRDAVAHPRTSSNETRSNPSKVTVFDENGVIFAGRYGTDEHRSYVFVVNELSQEMKQKFPNMQISIAASIANVFGYRNRMTLLVTTADEEEHCASHVELTFRDEYLSRGDMWRLSVTELSSKTVHKDQKLLFLGTIKATVKNIYVDGQKKRSGYFSAATKPIFRSEAARYTLFIQMSQEMWHFDPEGAGEIMFNKVINGFLPELFKNWMSIKAHHLVSIVLFARLEYREDHEQLNITEHLRQHASGQRDGVRDYYRVVVNEMASNDWIKILYQLKKEFRSFLKDISVVPQHSCDKGETKYTIAGKPCRAPKGNILEAISLASAHFSRDYIDRDLVRTGISVVVITAGTGIYEVDYDMLKLTTDTLMGSGIGIDLVCLSPMPLHSVPLFMYRNPRVIESAVPTAAPSPSQSVASGTPSQADSKVRNLSLPGSSITATPSPSQSVASGTLSQADSKVRNLSIPGSSIRQNKCPQPIPGDWSYALPHWLDVSYWTGTADEQAMLFTQRERSTKYSRQTGQGDQRFSLRCRLYELQMMGLMENEMTNISIEKLHEHPLHPWHRIQRQISGKPITKETENRIGKYELEWMSEYDEHVFRPLNERLKLEDEARKHFQTSAMDTSSLTTADSELTSDTYTDAVGMLGSSHHPSKGFLDWKLQEKVPATPTTLGRRLSAASLLSVTTIETTVSQKAFFNLRDFKSGISPSVTPKAIVAVSAATFIRNGESGSPRNPSASKITQQFKTALMRSASRGVVPSLEPLDEEGKEMSKPIDIGKATALVECDSSPEIIAGSVETIKGHTSAVEREKEKPKRPPRELESVSGLFNASKIRKQASQLSSSAERPRPIPKTVSLIRALAPWLALVNPCNPRKNDIDINSQFRRWQHVFPRPRKTGSVRWKSLCSPASVPLTIDFFPSAEQLATEYHESPYHLSQDEDDSMDELPKTREGLMRELIAFRLSHGFQLIVGKDVEEFLGAKSDDLAHIFDKNYMVRDGSTIFMCLGSTIHQLLCGSDGKIEIRRFTRKPAAEYESLEETNAVLYRPLIRTALAAQYEQREINFKEPKSEINWNVIDSFLAGCDHEFSDSLRFWRARFVLLPVDIPPHSRSVHGPRRPGLAIVTEDSEEEIRLEGIRRLTQVWQRNRCLPPEERVRQMQRRKDPNPLAIEYQTRDPSAVIAAGADSGVFADNDPTIHAAECEIHSTKNVDIGKLAEELQGERGIKMLDRRWHWRLHYNCFVGSDLTSWILLNFEDIQTREQAVLLGITLMEKGLFQHVQSKHQFRDGNFFFQIASTYRAPRPDSKLGWMGFAARRGPGSIPSTPLADTPRSASFGGRLAGSRPSTANSNSDQSGGVTPTKANESRKVFLSKVMKYNADMRKQSYRPEIINLHYDRLHNPDNCYHIRIDWMNVTAKFIEDSVVNWAQTVERYGLKLVELPIAEACKIGESHPFRAPYMIKLASPPPTSLPAQVYDTTSFSAVMKQDIFAYHRALLKKHQFVLDMESATSFPSDVDVMYSWGKPDYQYTQYVHRSGVVLAQITDEGEFLLLANRLYHDRAVGRREAARIDARELQERDFDRNRVGGMHRGRASPASSPLVRALPEPAPAKKMAEDITDELEALCSNVDALKAFYAEVIKPRSSPSPRTTPLQDASVPELALPSKLARGISPLPPLSKKDG